MSNRNYDIISHNVNMMNLNQLNGFFHPYTCGNEECKVDNCTLLATSSKWICPMCDYTQDIKISDDVKVELIKHPFLPVI